MHTEAKSKTIRQRIVSLWPFLILIAIGLFYLFAYVQGQKNIENAKVGDCTVYQSGDKKPYRLADCDSTEAKYKVLGIADTANKESCLNIAGTTRTVSSKNGSICMTEKNADIKQAINTINVGDCMRLTGSEGAKVSCSDADAAYKVLKRTDNVSKIAPASRCNDEPNTVKYYGWGIEQTGGTYRIKSVTYDRFFCLGENNG